MYGDPCLYLTFITNQSTGIVSAAEESADLTADSVLGTMILSIEVEIGVLNPILHPMNDDIRILGILTVRLFFWNLIV